MNKLIDSFTVNNKLAQSDKVRLVDKIFIIFFLIHYLRFFNCIYYQMLGDILHVIDALFVTVFFVDFLSLKKGKLKKINKSFMALYFLFFFSIIVGNYVSNQSFYYSFKATLRPALCFGFLFYLIKHNIPIYFIIKCFRNIGIAWILIMLLSYVQYPNVIFGININNLQGSFERLASEYESRGVYRFDIPGSDMIEVCLLIIMANTRKIKNSWLFAFVLALSLLLIGSRFQIVTTIFLSIITFLVANKFSIKRIVLLSVILLLSYTFVRNNKYTSNIINKYLDVTQTQVENNEKSDDIRTLSSTYFFTEFNNDKPIANFIGNGIPSTNGDYYERLVSLTDIGFYDNDVGYAEWFIDFGIIGLLIMLWWFIDVMKTKIPHQFIFIKFYACLLIITQIGGQYFYAGLVTVAMVMYILYRVKLNN